MAVEKLQNDDFNTQVCQIHVPHTKMTGKQEDTRPQHIKWSLVRLKTRRTGVKGKYGALHISW